MKQAHRRPDKTALDLIEEATHLLRVAPAGTLAAYYAGAIPFVIGLLYFCTDMSRSPFADEHLAEAALATTALFIWMKFWQALFALRIRSQIAGEPIPRWSLRQAFRVFVSQAVIQPTGLFVIPLAVVLTLPFGWVYAFYQNATALADSDSSDADRLMRRAMKQTSLWPLQNHVGIGVMSAIGICVFLNWALLFLWTPTLIKTFFGIESTFSRSPFAMLNSTFFAGICGLTYLCLDPALKTVYGLRCFYGESLRSGEDLKADLKRFELSPRHVASALVVSILLSCGMAANAAQVTPADLDRRIDQVIHESKYLWRAPRTGVVEHSEKGIITRFLQSMWDMARDWLRTFLDWFEHWIRRMIEPVQTGSGSARFASIAFPLLLYVLLAAALSILAIFLLRSWQRGKVAAVVETEGINTPPDIADEGVGADQLPEDGWMKLARELVERGEFRLAMRAFYLASLAHLAERHLIGIARFKSNRDYENELRRRGHAIRSLLQVFGENVSMFERIWYGMHEVDRELVLLFAQNVDNIKASA
jgi:hypothetical protein